MKASMDVLGFSDVLNLLGENKKSVIQKHNKAHKLIKKIGSRNK